MQVLHAWGMTEMSPIGTICSFKPEVAALPTGRRGSTCRRPSAIRRSRVDLKIVDDAGGDLPWDGADPGAAADPRRGGGAALPEGGGDAADAEGWFDTGDMATMDANGYVRITDRAKDIIKSGGEWISSIELENAARRRIPDVAEAAAVGVPHPKWGERPVLVVVPRPGQRARPGRHRGAAGGALRQVAAARTTSSSSTSCRTPRPARSPSSNLRRRLAEQGYALPG